MRLAITGATGFIGRHLVPECVKHFSEVYAISRGEGVQKGVIHLRCDLHDHGRVRELIGSLRPTHLVHLAWCAGPGYQDSKANREWYDSTIVLLDAFCESGGQRVIVSGTCAEYDWSTTALHDEWLPSTCAVSRYSEYKIRLLEHMMRFSLLTGVSFAWLRLFFVYGAGDHPGRAFPKLILNPAHPSSNVWRSDTRIRDYVCVSTVAKVISDLIDHNLAGPLNIGTGCGVSRRIISKLVVGASCTFPGYSITCGSSAVDAAPVIGDVTRLYVNNVRSLPAKPLSNMINAIQWWNDHA